MGMTFISRVISFRTALFSKIDSSEPEAFMNREPPKDKGILQKWRNGLKLSTGTKGAVDEREDNNLQEKSKNCTEEIKKMEKLSHENEKLKTYKSKEKIMKKLTPGPLEELEVEIKYKFGLTGKNVSLKMIVGIKVAKKDYKAGEPWLGEIIKVNERSVLLQWLTGSYEAKWAPDQLYQPETIKKDKIICWCVWDTDFAMPSELRVKMKNAIDGSICADHI
ncbi:hypothetical protein ScPMuIL_007554 [Solemya velum]